MNDRTSFLAAIRAQPDDDIPRLVYADWLDDNGTSDLDTATASFIRLGCGALDAAKKRQTIAEGKFLQDNWHRLLPSLAAAGYIYYRRNGRVLTLIKNDTYQRYIGPPERTESAPFRRWCIVEFWRGFARDAEIYQPRDLSALRFVGRDQPLTLLRVGDAVGVVSGYSFVHFAPLGLSHLPNDIFDRIVGHDDIQHGGNPQLPIAKVFNRREGEQDHTGHAERAQIALSKAIRNWIDSTPVLG